MAGSAVPNTAGFRRCRFWALTTFLILTAASFRAAAEDLECGATAPFESEIDQIVEQAMSDSRTPGIAIGIIDKGRVVYLKGHGVLRNDKSGPAVTCHTRFHVASLSKPVVATALLTSFERGELREDDSLAMLVSDTNARARIVDLMTHTAGMRDWYRADGRRTPEEKHQYFKHILRRTNRIDGTYSFHYSDTDYNLLGLMIEQHTGSDLHDFVAARVFAPLGMTESGFGLAEATVPDAAWPHVGKRGKPGDEHPFDIAFAASSGLQTSAQDMVLFMNAYLAQDAAVMGKASYALAAEPRHATEWNGVSQSLVWQVLESKYGTVLQHGGTDRGFRALISIYPDQGTGIVILANGETIDRWDLRARLEALVLNAG